MAAFGPKSASVSIAGDSPAGVLSGTGVNVSGLVDSPQTMGTGLGRLIEFFMREMVNLARRTGSSRWPISTGIVFKSEARESFWGCYVVSVHYRYRSANSRFEGIHKQPFVYPNYANAYLRRFPGGSEFVVRIDPKHQSHSVPENWRPHFTRAD